ncbi:YceH family protein [Capillimicrobium parvum]|uniref:Uncharacterized protein n=1 Tax=Capillimicrobium parvum TaxID=2884022 RepID=A0A9E6XY70_9ACTN|nr:YceH family protein [Capillimicrobium parvum]UGS36620.1 hypothetical protein DSM104329_03028 [Capillimicrobium parvum]
MEPDAVELRILGCLIEKQRTTPDAYPLSLNSLRLACNQSTNRDPVVDYDEATIRDALNRLYRRRWTRLTSGQGSRAAKYRHLLREELGLDDAELSLLAVLLLRGPQTPGELNQRAARLHPFAGLTAIDETLERLIARGMAERLPRRPGQKEERYVQRLGATGEAVPDPPAAAVVPAPAAATPAPAPAALAPAGPAPAPAGPAPAAAAPAPAAPVSPPADDGRLAALEREVADLRAEVAALRAELGG